MQRLELDRVVSCRTLRLRAPSTDWEGDMEEMFSLSSEAVATYSIHLLDVKIDDNH